MSCVISSFIGQAPDRTSKMDAWTGEFNAKFGPSGLTAYHIYPGIVDTKVLQNSAFFLPAVIFSKLFMPLLSRTIGNSARGYAEIPVFLAANPKSRGLGLEFSNEKLKPMKAPWIEEEPLKRRLVWEKLAAMVDGKK